MKSSLRNVDTHTKKLFSIFNTREINFENTKENIKDCTNKNT